MTIYSYEDALAASISYFNGEELPAKVFVDKYALRNTQDELLEKTPEDMHRRIAKEFARIEKNKFKEPLSEEFIFSLLERFKYIVPQGSPMYGIGNPYKYVTLSNCYLLTSPEDSYGGIHYTDEQVSHISKRRGGVGIDISKLRPEGSPTKNSSRTSTGILSFMDRYSNSCREVGQNSRRGAMMITLDVHHPQVLDFVTVKNDLTKVTGANISLRLSDEFLNAVKNDEDYELRFPVDSKKPKISKKVNAKSVWKEIIKNAHAMAEPGLLFWDTALRNSPADCYSDFGFRSEGCNPCLSSKAKLLTKQGIKNLSDVNIGDLIWSKEGWTTVLDKWSTGIKDVYKYSSTGGSVYCTKNHRLVVDNENTKVQAENAESINVFTAEKDYKSVDFDLQSIVDGLVIGDGYKHCGSVVLIIGKDDQDYFTSEISGYIGKSYSNGITYKIETNITENEVPHTYIRFIPERFILADEKIKCSFLRGLYSANGSVVDNRITLKSSSKQVIEDVQLMLSSLGISSYYTTNKETKVKFSNGEYTCKQSYDLNITGDRQIFVNKIGFIQKYKNEKINLNIIPKKNPKNVFDINCSEYYSTEEVFDITVDNKSHTFWCNGCNISNCSEIILSVLDSCRLLLQNLYSYVVNPFTKDAYFDFNLFYKHAKIAQRLMDDLIDLELECIDRIIAKIDSDPEDSKLKAREREIWEIVKTNCINGRRTGSGITALGDTIAACGFKYDSDEGLALTEKIYKTLKFACYESSIDMAEELGPFPLFDNSLEVNCEFFNRFKQEKLTFEDSFYDGEALMNRMSKSGRRNIALLTTAPAGTVSILTETTSGIEPLFMTHYVRKKKGNLKDENFRCDFTDQNGDTWMEFNVYHPKLNEWMKITGENDISKSPYYGACANDINWVRRVKLQALAAQHVDHSISSTINLPNNVSVDEVAKIYETAWETGTIKGMTVYRDGCRTGVLTAESSSKQKENHRPKIVDCEVHHATVKGNQYFVLLGMIDGKIYEVFAGKNGVLDKNIKNAKIVKKRGGHYHLVSSDTKEIYLAPITVTCNEEEEAVTRLTSLLLRSGTDLHEIVIQLEKVSGNISSFSKAIARVLKKHIPDDTVVKEKCPQCGADSMVRQEGCVTCKSCGYSKCL